jgi:hypothetical protein
LTSSGRSPPVRIESFFVFFDKSALKSQTLT